ncbi:50S ribosomal protein L3 [Candidatus Curtissbacteria bacterium]|nr:50S ribosomal protein L3 [Candidatus Curtissbacteria bacterium]
MIQTIFGIKGNMTTRFDKNGHRVAVTQIKADPSVVAFKKEGRVAIAFGKRKNPNKAQTHFITSLGFAPRHIHEIKSQEDIKTGDTVTVSNFQKQDLVKVTGTSKGRGFAGGIRRWGFHGGPKTHGQSDRHRAPGSIGQTTTPGRVYKGKKMAGHMGAVTHTTRDLEIFEIILDTNTIEVIGAVPGHKNGVVIIEKTGKAKAYVAPPEEKKDDEEEDKENKDEKKPEAKEEPQETKEEKKEEK